MTRTISAALAPARNSRNLTLMFAFALLTLLALPFTAQAQGIIGGAQEGVHRGNRAAGPVGGVVGGAIGAGVGGVVGGVRGVIGAPNRSYRRGHNHRRSQYRRNR